MASATLKTINGRLFSIAKLDAVNGIRLQLAVAKLAGSEIATLGGLVGKALATAPKKADGSIDGPALVAQVTSTAGLLDEVGEMLERVATKASEDELLRLMMLVFSRVTVAPEGQQIAKPITDINLTFGDDSATPWLVFVEGLKVTLGGFLAGLLSDSSQPASVGTSQ